MNMPLFNRAIKPAILEALNKAESEINIAVAWITDKEIIEVLTQKSNEGVIVKVILSSEANQQIAKTIEFESEGKIRVYILDKTGKSMMHHKFCIIDSRVVITGSYNYTHNAIHNDENIMIIEDKEVALNYRNEYQRLLSYFPFTTNLSRQKEDKSYKLKENDVKDSESPFTITTLGEIPTNTLKTFTSSKGKHYLKYNNYLIAVAKPEILKQETVTIKVITANKDYKLMKAGDAFAVAE